MSVSLVSTQGRPVPYLTLAELKHSPIYNQLKQMVPGSSDADRDAELSAIIRRATGMINGECNQNLAASVDTEIGRVRFSTDGDLRLHTRSDPIIEVLSVSVGPDPANLTPITDLSNIVIDPWRITIPGGSTSSLNLPSPSQCGRIWAKWTYVNGFPITTLTAPANAGDTSITVADTTGILPGQTLPLVVEDGKWAEQFFPTAVTSSTTLTVPPLTFAHQAGIGVSSLPNDIKEATLLLISRLHDTWSLTMNVIDMGGHGSKKPASGPSRALCDAAVMLAPYRRVW